MLRQADPPHSGVRMGCLRRPQWPSTVYCVLATAVVAVSISPSGAQDAHRGVAPVAHKTPPGAVGEWNFHNIAVAKPDSNAAAVVAGCDRRFDCGFHALNRPSLAKNFL